MSDVPLIHPPDTELQALDPGALSRLEHFGGRKLLLEMIGLFETAAPERIAAANKGIESGDVAATELALHSLKSSSGQLGAVRLGQLSEQGEVLARAGTVQGVAEIVQQMSAELVRVQAWLSAARREASS
jgi:HPt (histidine-containing phosphotransfer) domain-containing protein